MYECETYAMEETCECAMCAMDEREMFIYIHICICIYIYIYI